MRRLSLQYRYLSWRQEAVGFILVCVLLIGLIAYGFIHLDKVSCHKKGDNLGVDTSYDTWAGCFVEVDGRFIPLDNYRIEGDPR